MKQDEQALVIKVTNALGANIYRAGIIINFAIVFHGLCVLVASFIN